MVDDTIRHGLRTFRPYAKALAVSQKVGASVVRGDTERAQVCMVLSHVHAINPEMLYVGASLGGLSGQDLVRLAHIDPAGLGAIQFSVGKGGADER